MGFKSECKLMKTTPCQDTCIDLLLVELDDSSHNCGKEYLTPDKYLLMVNNKVSAGSADGYSE